MTAPAKMKQRLPFYNYGQVKSYNAKWNFVCGARGLGKTYGAKENAVKEFFKTGNMFILLRRYREELAAAKRTFFADIDELFPDWDFETQGNIMRAAPAATRDDDKRPWQDMGYFIALSTSQGQKGMSFHKVRTIIFDEFIIERGAGRYLPAEDVVMLNFYSTVDRYRSKCKVYFLANAVSINNPYFLAYDIQPDKIDPETGKANEFVSRRNGFVVAHFPESKAFATAVYETEFGKFIQDSEYADYAVGNTFEDNNDHLLRLKTAKARYLFTLQTGTGVFSVWLDSSTREYYVQAKLPKEQTVYTLDMRKMTADKMFMEMNSRPMQILRTAFNQARVSFDRPVTRNAFIEVFKK